MKKFMSTVVPSVSVTVVPGELLSRPYLLNPQLSGQDWLERDGHNRVSSFYSVLR